MNLTVLGAALLLSYLLGCVPFAVLVSRVAGLQDPRSFGSGNPGATNVLRSGNKWAALLTLVLDAAKGWLPVALVGWFGASYGLYGGAQAAVGLAALLGHVFSVFLRFKGGKGVATALGVLLGLSFWLGFFALLIWIAVFALSRISSLASLCTVIATPLVYLLFGGELWPLDRSVVVFITLMATVLVYRHIPNIGRLIRGTEPRSGFGRKAPGGPVAVRSGKAAKKPRQTARKKR